MKFWRLTAVSIFLLLLVGLISFTSAIDSPSLQFNASIGSLSLNWTNNDRQNITITANPSNSGSVLLQLHTSNTGISGNYSQRSNYPNSTSNSKYYDSCFFTDSDLDSPLVAFNQTADVTNLTGSMSNGTSQIFTVLHNSTCPPGKYYGEFSISNTSNSSSEQLNLSVEIDVLLGSSNALNTTTGTAEFKGTMPANANTYHSYFFNTSSVSGATGIVANLTWSSASKDLDLFLLDSSSLLKAKSIGRNQSTEELNYNYLAQNRIWEIRVYGNFTASESYTGTLYLTTHNASNASATTQQLETIDFGSRNTSYEEQVGVLITNDGSINTSSLSEATEIYHTENFSGSGSSTYTFLVPSFATKVKVLLNWTGGSNYTLKLYNPAEVLIGSSNDKFRIANATGVSQEEFVETTSVSSSPNNLWKAEVESNSGSDLHNLEARFYVASSGWLSSNFSSAVVNAGSSKPHHFNLTVPGTAVSGLYKGSLKYTSNQSLEIGFQVNITSPSLILNETYNTGTKTVKENIGYNRTGNALEIIVQINNTGNTVMGLVSSNSSNLSKGSNFMPFVFSMQSSLNPESSDNLRINVTVSTPDTGNSDGIYTGWIFLNGTAAPYHGFNLTLEVNLTDSVTGTLNHSPSIIQSSNQENNITLTVNAQLQNGTSISNNLNFSNFIYATLIEKNVTTYSQNLTNLTNITASSCSGGLCTLNATVPAGLIGGRYRISVNFNATSDDGSVLTGSVQNATTLTINDTGLNLTPVTSLSVGDIDEATTSIFNITVTNFGPKIADDVKINFSQEGCTNITISTKDSSTGSGSSSVWTADIEDSTTHWFRWNIVGGSVTEDVACSGAKIIVDQKSFNNITGIAWTVKNTGTSDSSSSDSSSSSSSSAGGGGASSSSSSSSLTITDAVDSLEIVQGQIKSTTVKVKNTGTSQLTVTFKVIDLDLNINYSVEGSKTISSGSEQGYAVTFRIPEDLKVGEYTGRFKAESGLHSDTEDFEIAVLPSEENKIEIQDYNKIYEKLLKSLSDRHQKVKTLCKLPETNPLSSLNTADKLNSVDNLFNESNNILVLLNSALKDGDYLRSQKHADSLREKADRIDTLLLELEDYNDACIQIANQGLAVIVFYTAVGSIIMALAGLFVYSYYPSRKGYIPGRGFSIKNQRSNIFKEAMKSFKSFGKSFKKKEETIVSLENLEKMISKEYSATKGYLRREIEYDFKQISAWSRLKSKLGNTFKFGRKF